MKWPAEKPGISTMKVMKQHEGPSSDLSCCFMTFMVDFHLWVITYRKMCLRAWLLLIERRQAGSEGAVIFVWERSRL